MIETITNLDVSFLDWVYNYVRNDVLSAFFSFVTHFGDAGIFWILLSVILMIPKKTRTWGFAVFSALLMGVIVGNGIIKPLVARIRPYDLYDKVHGTEGFIDTIVKKPNDFSFPSGHTQASFAAATAIVLNSKKWGAPALILAAFVGLSRIYLYIHYPSDVIAGMLFGILWGFLSVCLIRFLTKKFPVFFGKAEN